MHWVGQLLRFSFKVLTRSFISFALESVCCLIRCCTSITYALQIPVRMLSDTETNTWEQFLNECTNHHINEEISTVFKTRDVTKMEWGGLDIICNSPLAIHMATQLYSRVNWSDGLEFVFSFLCSKSLRQNAEGKSEDPIRVSKRFEIRKS